MNNWKDKYSDTWETGNERENVLKKLLESYGFKPIVHGFGAMSTEYIAEKSKEPGKPDFYIEVNGEKVYFEVTGTHFISEYAPIWVRPDKINYAKKHNIKCYLVHIISAKRLVRFIDMAKIDGYIIHPTTRRGNETFVEFNPSQMTPMIPFMESLNTYAKR